MCPVPSVTASRKARSSSHPAGPGLRNRRSPDTWSHRWSTLCTRWRRRDPLMLRATIAGVDLLGMPTLDPTVPRTEALLVRFVYTKGGIVRQGTRSLCNPWSVVPLTTFGAPSRSSSATLRSSRVSLTVRSGDSGADAGAEAVVENRRWLLAWSFPPAGVRNACAGIVDADHSSNVDIACRHTLLIIAVLGCLLSCV